ncbi:N-ethylmaleimide reductase [Winogradskyella wandonensis]|uniref:N-ethylmaleimide reductase n=1 Tax=Winogradskyella wandonensis TaxID=1442586 RepID=A0A4V2PU67_9FLAO|nr:alkene reductase [Winogradskyella wandonensis]TCK69311.1 N-ethylmaleimide reductase [Winogradskyella wandonensis]
MNIFESYQLGDITLNNRIVMAPMTRCRAIDNIPNDLMATYYGQRATAGLIISEGTSPSVNGIGYARIPGAYSPAQIEGWKTIAKSVHDNNGILFVQLMHCGRVSASENLPEGGTVVAPSAVKAAGEMYTDSKGMVEHAMPKAILTEQIETTQQEFVDSAQKLVRAGVDGVELHAANGYLLDQFLNPKSNMRTDDYGGNFKNRARFVIETAEKVASAIGAGKVGIRISPYGAMNDVDHDYDDLIDLYAYLAQELRKIGIAYIHIADHSGTMGAPDFKTDIKSTIKLNFNGTIITGGDVNSKDDAQNVIDDGYDLAYVGRPFISNPDLVAKFKNDKDLKEPNADLFYTPGAEGYTDYE